MADQQDKNLPASHRRFDAAMVRSPDAMLQVLASQTQRLLMVMLPLGVMMAALAVAAAVASGGWNFSFKPLVPSFGKLNPLSGLGRLVSTQHLGDTLKASLLAIVLGAIGAVWLHVSMARFHDELAMPLPAAL